VELASVEEREAVPLKGDMLRQLMQDLLKWVEEHHTQRRVIELHGSSKDNHASPSYSRVSDFFEEIEVVFAKEAESLASGLFSFLGRRERMSRAIVAAWGRLMLLLEDCWNENRAFGAGDAAFASSNPLQQKLQLLSWCIDREAEWLRDLKAEGVQNVDTVLPQRPKYTAWPRLDSLDARLEDAKKTLSARETELRAELGMQSSEPTQREGGVGVRLLNLSAQEKEVYGEIRVPLTLNCDLPPASYFLDDFDLKVAGTVIAESRLRADMGSFKAVNSEATFEAFLRWHSPKDVSLRDGSDGKVQVRTSQRMGDSDSHWLLIWREVEAAPLNPTTFKQHVTFNHRAVAGQLLTQLAVHQSFSCLVGDICTWLREKMSCELGTGDEDEDNKDDLLQKERGKAVRWAQMELGLQHETGSWLVGCEDEGERDDFWGDGLWRVVSEEVVTGSGDYYCGTESTGIEMQGQCCEWM